MKSIIGNKFPQMTLICEDHFKRICEYLRYMRETMVCFLLFTCNCSSSQTIPYTDNYFAVNAGVNIALGTHFDRIGIVINGAYVNDHFQANVETRWHYNVRNLGPRKKHGEFTTSLGVLFAGGEQQSFYNPFYNSVSNQTGYKYGVGYSYNFYFNKIKTSQRTGIIAFHLDKFSLLHENDLLGAPALDRFRTGAFLIQFQNEYWYQASINCSLWTGKMGFKTDKDDVHFRFGCYMDTTGGIYSNHSYGLLSGQFKYYLGYGQNAQANIGLDAEQVRNVVQNEIIHDMNFLPKKWIKNKNCHIPMLDDKGEQYLFKEGQRVRPAKIYFNLSGNQSLFY